MADKKITQLAMLADPIGTDVLTIVDDPAGAPVTKQVTVASVLALVWPVGSVFLSVVAASPATLLGFGTWVACAVGRFIVGVDTGDSEFDTEEETGGAKTHTLAEANLPAHSHGVTDPGHAHVTQRYPTTTGGSSGFTADTSMSGTPADNTLATKAGTTGITIQNTGGGTAVNHLPPYFAVRAWKRTA